MLNKELIARIFAATAASIFTPSPSTSGTSTPINVAHSSTRSWTTTTFGQVNPLPKPGTGVSTAARISKEQARRGLYSRFMRGKVVVPDPDSESEQSEGEGLVGDNKTKEVVAGPSTPLLEEMISSKASKGKGKGKETRGEETKEEKRIRKAEKAKKKEEKEARRALESNHVNGASTPIGGDEEVKSSRKRKDLDLGEDGVGKVKKVKKEKKDSSSNGDVVEEGEKTGKKDKGKKDKKSKKDWKTGEES